MGTHALISVEGIPINLYKHSDGYPSEIIPWLLSFRERFMDNRCWDDSYMLAQLVRNSVTIDNAPFTGWGLYSSSVDIASDYYYQLTPTGVKYHTGDGLWKYVHNWRIYK
mgnify:CR=1 FL=1